MMLLSRGISDFHITGSDIRGDLLEKAQRGVYDSVPLLNPFRDMLAEYWHYFDGNGLDKTYRVCDTVKTLVKFTHANVLESRTVPLGQFDVILCRNLLIYFDEHSKRKALEQMWKKLAPNGYLCLGAGDSIYKHLVMLETVDDTVGNSIYRKRE
jgi:chemotaxis protein methyltransferase CheR